MLEGTVGTKAAEALRMLVSVDSSENGGQSTVPFERICTARAPLWIYVNLLASYRMHSHFLYRSRFQS